MSNAKRLDEKDPGETVPLSWDFSIDLGEEGTIADAPIVNIAIDNDLRRNTESPITLVANGAPQVDGQIVLQSASGGKHGVDYKITCQIPTSGIPASLIFKSSILPVRYQ